MKNKITENLKRINDNIADACARTHRDPADIRLVAVTKTVEVETIHLLLEMGLCDLGESRVQQLTQRQAMIDEFLARRDLHSDAQTQPPAKPRWHMIGHLQRNKVKPILPIVHSIHSVDSLRLAEEINTNAARLGLADRVKIFLQVNTSQEKQKYGLAVGAVAALAEQIRTLPNLEIIGLMAMGPLTEDLQLSRFCFARLREIFEEMRGEKIVGPSFKHLSMGMSNDYVIAVEEGATVLRIGSTLFE